MSKTTGECGLCWEPRPLRDSHLLPAAIYAMLRETVRPNPNPVAIANDRSVATSKQVTAPFLCEHCEERFSRCGERLVLSQCARSATKFPLRDLLREATPSFTAPEYRIYDVAPLLGEHVEHYLYFAASIFWRASARSWGHHLTQLGLGSRYAGQFRAYLLGQAPFPANARIFVKVWDDDPVDRIATVPCSERVGSSRRHKFGIPGIAFVLFLGGDAARQHDLGAVNSTRGSFMWLCPFKDDSLFDGFLNRLRRSKPAGALARR